MKKMRLWDWKEDWEGNAKNMLIDDAEIEERVYVGDSTVALIETDASIEELQAAIDKYFEDNIDDHILNIIEDAFDEAEIKYHIEYKSDYVDVQDVIVWDGEFTKLMDWERDQTYEWFDGKNWVVTSLDPSHEVETVIEIFDEYVNLDEWNGSSQSTGGNGLHQRVYRVYTVDGEEVSDTYLIEYWSQWQGSHATAELMDSRELEAHLEEIGRDIEEYMTEVAELGN